jgi:hypothetical protein
MNVRIFVTEFWYTGEADYRASIRASKDFIDKKFEKVVASWSLSGGSGVVPGMDRGAMT